MNQQINTWISQKPCFKKIFHEDTISLAQYIKIGDAFFEQLPTKNNRTFEENAWAENIHSVQREVRKVFLGYYAEEVYAILTKNFSEFMRLDSLVKLAEEKFPGLVPSETQMIRENACVQKNKEGFEIDQGIFFSELFRVSNVGRHLMHAMRIPLQKSVQLLSSFKKEGEIKLKTVLLKQTNNSGMITITNNACLNAETNQLVEDLETAIDLILLTSEINVGVIRGGIMTHPRYKGKRVFSAGINLRELSLGKISFVNFLLTRELGFLSKIMHGLYTPTDLFVDSTKPWVGVVDSFAIGGGMQILLVLDKIIAAEDAYFSLPAAQEGIIPGAANFRLASVNPRLARKIILSSKKIFATDKEAEWLCDDIVPVEQLEKTIEHAIKDFNSPAVKANRYLLNSALESLESFRIYMAEFSYVQAVRLYSQDVLEKIARLGDKGA